MSSELRSGELAGEIAAGNWSRTVRVACVDSGDELRTSTGQDRMMSELLMFSSACRSVRVINSSTMWFNVLHSFGVLHLFGLSLYMYELTT